MSGCDRWDGRDARVAPDRGRARRAFFTTYMQMYKWFGARNDGRWHATTFLYRAGTTTSPQVVTRRIHQLSSHRHEADPGTVWGMTDGYGR